MRYGIVYVFFDAIYYDFYNDVTVFIYETKHFFYITFSNILVAAKIDKQMILKKRK